jgi:acyl-CoA synthetase (AMP-forming)/AMP-acid ligase II/acyl carrier protein
LERIKKTMKSLSDVYINIKRNGHRLFLLGEHSQVTYATLLNSLRHIIGLFEHHQLSQGHRIIICSDNDEFITAAVAAAFFHGITTVVLTPETSESRLKSIIRKAAPALIFLDDKLQTIWQLSGEFAVFSIVDKQNKSSALLSRFKRSAKKGWLSTLAEYPMTEPSLPTNTALNCFLNFTSGTTGDPKGVQITYKNLLTHLQTLTNVFEYSIDSRILNNMILAHADGLLQGPILAIFNACTLYRPFNMDVQNLEPLLNSVYRERITHMLTVPTILSFIDRFTEHDDYFNSEDFLHLISVAGMLDTNIWTRLENRLSVRISNIYGLTETVAGGIFCGPADDNFCRGTIGKPIDLAIRIVDENNEPIAAGQQGELWLKGDNVFPGYFESPQQTAASFTGEWFHTGDIANIDVHGFVRICGRKKELIISGGFNIHPAEVDEALLRNKNIAEAVTFGQQDPDWQEVVVSAVVLKDGAEIKEQDVIDHCRQWLEPKKIPRKIHFMTRLPRGDAGKINLPELRTLLVQVGDEPSNHVKRLDVASLLTLAAEIFQVNQDTLSMQSRVGDTPGWDSLGHLTLIVKIEEISAKSLSAQQMMAIQTLADVLETINE